MPTSPAAQPDIPDQAPSRQKPGNRIWRNWSGSQTATPSAWLRPESEAELVRQLRNARGQIRVTGAGHSFSALCTTPDTLVSLDRLRGLVSHDSQTQQATIRAGSRLQDLGEPLWELGQGLINQGDVDVQSLGGACGTSTHGTGRELGSLSAQVRGLRLVTPDGEVVEADAEHNAEIWQAGATSLGALGVVTQITLQNRARYHLAEHEFLLPLNEVLRRFDQLARDNRHAEFWAFFRSDQAIVKLLNETEAAPTPAPRFQLPVSMVLNLTSRVAHGIPGADGAMQKLLTGLHSEMRRSGRAYQIFPSPRDARFNEMEYEVPVERGLECVQEIFSTVRRSGIRTLFPLEYRRVAADDVWLSPFFGRDSASISLHQHICTDYRPLFDLVEPIFWKYGGRPHWGKLHSLDATRLAELYPYWEDFARVRKQLDPDGRMLNDHLRRILVQP
ncbi:MAG: FAD-linked oxidoreductase [Alteromonadaceae bacterium]|nr:FAD-linked oxidoreductase [Alteromonadaceae bacterium]|tara:strand:+ start:1249 stop:2586 length:1338 start_codon:yes stop_codon:yes gene_type:complete